MPLRTIINSPPGVVCSGSRQLVNSTIVAFIVSYCSRYVAFLWACFSFGSFDINVQIILNLLLQSAKKSVRFSESQSEPVLFQKGSSPSSKYRVYIFTISGWKIDRLTQLNLCLDSSQMTQLQIFFVNDDFQNISM